MEITYKTLFREKSVEIIFEMQANEKYYEILSYKIYDIENDKYINNISEEEEYNIYDKLYKIAPDYVQFVCESDLNAIAESQLDYYLENR